MQQEVSGTRFGELDGTNDVVIVPAPANGVRRFVTTLRIINVDSAAATPTVRLRRVGVVPSGLALYVTAFADIALASGRELTRPKEVMLTPDYELVASLATTHTDDPPTFVTIWMDLV